MLQGIQSNNMEINSALQLCKLHAHAMVPAVAPLLDCWRVCESRFHMVLDNKVPTTECF